MKNIAITLPLVLVAGIATAADLPAAGASETGAAGPTLSERGQKIIDQEITHRETIAAKVRELEKVTVEASIAQKDSERVKFEREVSGRSARAPALTLDSTMPPFGAVDGALASADSGLQLPAPSKPPVVIEEVPAPRLVAMTADRAVLVVQGTNVEAKVGDDVGQGWRVKRIAKDSVTVARKGSDTTLRLR